MLSQGKGRKDGSDTGSGVLVGGSLVVLMSMGTRRFAEGIRNVTAALQPLAAKATPSFMTGFFPPH